MPSSRPVLRTPPGPSWRYHPWDSPLVAACAMGLVLTLPGCGEGEGPERLDAVPEWSLSAQPSAVIGENDALPGHDLHEVLGATRLSDGTIVVIESGPARVRRYASDGRHLGDIGGRGEGPDEFNGTLGGWARGAGDTLSVLWIRGIARLPGAARVGERLPLSPSQFTLPCRTFVFSYDTPLLPDGSLLMHLQDGHDLPGCGPAPSGPHRLTTLLARLDPARDSPDTLGVFPGEDRDGHMYGLFGRVLASAASPDRVYAGDTGADSIVVMDYEGRRIGTRAVPFAAREVPASVRGALTNPRSDDDPEWAFEGTPHVPDRFPLFSRLLVDGADHLWIAAYPPMTGPVDPPHRLTRPHYFLTGEEGTRWAVLDPDGRLVARVHTPPDLFVSEVGRDHLLAIARSELGVLSVRMYGLARAER